MTRSARIPSSRGRRRPRAWGRHLLTLALACLAAAGAARPSPATLVWEERGLPAGGRVLLAGGISSGLACLGLSVPAGTASHPEDPLLPLLAPRAFLGAAAAWEPAVSLETALARLGWRIETHCGLESAEISLLGPVAGLETVMGLVVERLQSPGAVSPADLEAAWSALEADWARWAASPEIALREAMAQAAYAGHPYAGGEGRLPPAQAAPPALASLADFLRERYQAGGLVLLLAGDFDPLPLLARWQARLDALPGQPLATPVRPLPLAQGSELLRAEEGSTLLLYQFPGPAGDGEGAPAAALLAGVLNLFVQTDLRGSGLVASGGAWYDFACPGPRPLELQLRGFAPERLPALKATVERILERLREGEFSEYQVITAKDQLFTRLDAAAGLGLPPADGGVQALSLWCREILRESLYFARWRPRFEQQALAASLQSLSQEAARLLLPERATLGLLLPAESLD